MASQFAGALDVARKEKALKESVVLLLEQAVMAESALPGLAKRRDEAEARLTEVQNALAVAEGEATRRRTMLLAEINDLQRQREQAAADHNVAMADMLRERENAAAVSQVALDHLKQEHAALKAQGERDVATLQRRLEDLKEDLARIKAKVA